MMRTTRILPTDKSGQIYYGPKTSKQAEEIIREMDAEPAKVVKQMRDAGYTRAASNVAKAHGIDK